MTIIILTHIHIHIHIQICILQYREREIVPLCPFRFRLVHLFRENLSIQASKLGGYLHSGSNERLLQPIIGTVWISSPAWSAHFPPFSGISWLKLLIAGWTFMKNQPMKHLETTDQVHWFISIDIPIHFVYIAYSQLMLIDSSLGDFGKISQIIQIRPVLNWWFWGSL